MSRLAAKTDGPRREYLVAAGLYAIVVCVWFWPLLAGEQMTQAQAFFDVPPWAASAPSGSLPVRAVFPDGALTAWPWMSVAKDQLSSSHLPLWNPYEYGGQTLVGNSQSALFSPLTWPLLVLPFGPTWGFLALVKLVIAGLGTYALSRCLRISRGGALIAGGIYMLSAPLMAWLQWPLAAVFAFFPWLLLATLLVLRRRSPGSVVAVAAATALTLLAGHLESALFALSSAGVFLTAMLILRRGIPGPARLRTSLLWVGGCVLGVGVAAVALLPFLEAFGPSVTRSSNAFLAPAADLPLHQALQYAFPPLFGDGEPRVYGAVFFNSVAAHFGTPALVLALVGLARTRRRPIAWALAAMAGVALMAAYGVPPVSWVRDHVPPWSHAIVLERADFVVALAGALGAGACLSELARRPARWRVVAVIALGGGALIGLAFTIFELSGSLTAPPDVKRLSLIVGFTGLAAGVALIAASGRLPNGITYALAAGIVLASLAGLRGLNVTLPPKKAYPPQPRAIAELKRLPGPTRLGVIREPGRRVLRPNAAALYGVEAVEGYDFPLSRRWSELQTRTLGFVSLRPESRAASGVPSRRALAGYRALNTRYFLAAPGTAPPVRAFRTVYRGADATIFEDPKALPRAYVAPSRLKAAVAMPSPDHVRVRVPAGAQGRLVLANAYHPSWKAEVDGRETELRPESYARMGVNLPRGARTADFYLDRRIFWLGAAISGLSLLACLALALSGEARRRWRERRG